MGRELTAHEQDLAMLSAHSYGDTNVLPANWEIVKQISGEGGFAATTYHIR
jgi:hypothetical protein